MQVEFENINLIANIAKEIQSIKKLLESKTQKRWLNTNELASYLGYSADRIYDLKESEFIEGVHYFKKGKLLFDKEEIDKWVMSSSVSLTPQEIATNVLKDLV